MKYTKLGTSDISISLITLGTMTWGEQNTPNEAYEQMAYAKDQGVNCLDIAEMYPVPPKADTYGDTESIIGRWFQQNPSERDSWLVATKVTGPSEDMSTYMGRGPLHFDRKNIETALNHSLKRLNTDYIDLYQLHWPDRSANFFGRLGYAQDGEFPEDHPESVALEETLSVLHDLVKAGKIRTIGLSNETPWGAMKACEIARSKGYDQVVSIQNPYNLLNRTYEVGLSEISHRENIGLLAYSPLAFGVLSGKYRHGAKPKNARLTLFDRFTRYLNPQAQLATEAYLTLADDLQIDPSQLALAFVNRMPFVATNIIGATTMEQLKINIGSIDVELPTEALERIDAIHQNHPNPSP